MAPSSRREKKAPSSESDERFRKSMMARVSTLKKKAKELSTLCDISVCVLCYGRDGNLHVWPGNHEDAKRILMKYKGLSEKEKRKHMVDLQEFSTGKPKRDLKETQLNENERLDGLSEEELMELMSRLDSKLAELNEKKCNLENSKQRDGTVEETNNGGNDRLMMPFRDDDVASSSWDPNSPLFDDGFELEDSFVDQISQLLDNGPWNL